jgi:hypothetical protein
MEKMNDFDYKLREQSITSQIDMISNQSSVLIVSKNHELFTEKLAEKECIIDIAKTKNDSNNELMFEFQNIENKKFHTILLDDTIDNVSNPIELIKQIKGFLMPEGFLLCVAYNLFNSINRLRFLNGDSQVINSILKNRNLEFSSLDSILLTLSESDLSVRKIIRVEEEINLKSKLDLNTFTFTKELIKALTSDSESKTFYYVFTIINSLSVNANTRRWISKFSKNLVTEGFKDILTKYKLDYEKHINYLKQTNREQYALMLNVNDYDKTIKPKKDKISNSEDNKKFQKELETDVLEDSKIFLKKSLKEKDNYLETAIKEEREYLETAITEKDEYLENAMTEKDEYLENAIKQKDEYIETALKDKDDYLQNALKETDQYVRNALRDKDEVIHAMQNSFAFRILTKFDRLVRRKHKKK